MCARRDFPSLVCVGFGVNTVVVVFAFFDAEGRPVRVPKKAPRTKAITGWTRLNSDPATDADNMDVDEADDAAVANHADAADNSNNADDADRRLYPA